MRASMLGQLFVKLIECDFGFNKRRTKRWRDRLTFVEHFRRYAISRPVEPKVPNFWMAVIRPL
jgi:hypothetical protein